MQPEHLKLNTNARCERWIEMLALLRLIGLLDDDATMLITDRIMAAKNEVNK